MGFTTLMRKLLHLQARICFCQRTLLFCFFSTIFTVSEGQLTSIQPMNGPLGGGSTFTLFGGSFNTICTSKSITFNTVSAISVTISASSITGTVPAYSSGTTPPVTISYSGSGSCTSQSFSIASLFSYDTPVFNGILYGSKGTAGGSSITISGKNFLASSSVKIGSTSSSCTPVSSFLSFKCALPAFSSGARFGLDVIVTMNSVQTTLIKFAYDAPVLSKILPQVPKLDGMAPITIFGTNLENNAQLIINIGALSCGNVIMITPHQEFSCLPSISNELVRTIQQVRVSLLSGATAAMYWNFETTNAFLHSTRHGEPMFECKSHSHLSNLNFTDSKYSHSLVVIGTGLSIATAGQLSTFAILLMDVFSVGYPQRSSCDQFIAVSSNFGHGEQWLANSSSQQCQNGTYSLSYNLTKSGKFTLSFLLLKG
jgi:hypothetical protein